MKKLATFALWLLANHSGAAPWEAAPGSYFLLMNKDSNVLTIRSLTDHSKIYKTYRAITGTNPGDKQREGDHRTPEGIYFLEREIPFSKLAPLHGPAAFELNYPNVVDRIFKRTGSGIWIHGVDRPQRMEKKFDTRGCIAVSNPDVLEIQENLRAHNKYPIPIVVVANSDQENQMGIITQQQTELWSQWKNRLDQWVTAWRSKNADPYLDFYDENFFARNMNLARWRTHKTRLTNNYEFIDVQLGAPLILHHGKYTVTVFQQNYKSDQYQSQGIKRMYWVGNSPDQAKILSEEMFEGRSL